MQTRHLLSLYLCVIAFLSFAQVDAPPTKSRLIVDYQFEEAWLFREGLAAVKKNGKWGFIDAKGATKIGFQYDEVKQFAHGAAAVRKGNAWYLIDQNGTIKTPAMEKVSTVDSLPKGKINGRWGAYNRDFTVCIPFKYDFFYLYDEGFMIMDSDRPNSKGVLNFNGDTLIPCKYFLIQYGDRRFFVGNSEGKFAFFDLSGKALTEFKYGMLEAQAFHHDAAVVLNEGGFALMDTNCRLICSGFSMISDWNRQFIVASKSKALEEVGVYDYRNDAWVVPPIYSEIYLDDYGHFTCTKDEMTELLDIEGKSLSTPIPHSMWSYGKNVYIVRSANSKEGCYFLESKKLIEPNYDDVSFDDDHKLVVLTKGQLFSVANSEGIIIASDLQSGDYPYISENKLAVKGTNGLLGYLTFE